MEPYDTEQLYLASQQYHDETSQQDDDETLFQVIAALESEQAAKSLRDCPHQPQRRLFNTIADILGEPSLSSPVTLDVKLLQHLSRQGRDSQCPYSTDQLIAATEDEDAPIFHYFLDLPPELRDNIYRFAIPTLESSGSSITIRKRKDCPTEPALLRVNRQIRHETWSIYYMENKFVFPIKDFNAKTYVRWCRASLLRLKANVRLSCSSSRTTHFSQKGPWGKLLHWLKHYYYGVCHGITSWSDRERSHQWQLAAEMFDLVNSLTHDHDMFWPQIKAILENVHGGIIAANLIKD